MTSDHAADQPALPARRCRVMIRPVTMLETSRPPTMQIDIRPASVGLMPRARWK